MFYLSLRLSKEVLFLSIFTWNSTEDFIWHRNDFSLKNLKNTDFTWKIRKHFFNKGKYYLFSSLLQLVSLTIVTSKRLEPIRNEWGWLCANKIVLLKTEI